MSVKKISGAEYSLSKIFSSDFDYVIPAYQRPYAWTVDQTSELFDDLYDFYFNEQDEGYFLGSIVLIKEEAAPLAEVIDGQQRLTTLTILLATLAAAMEGAQRDTLLRYLCEPGNEFEGLTPKPRLTLRERDQPFFNEYIQGLKFTELAGPGFTGCGTRLASKPCLVGVGGRGHFWRVPTRLHLFFYRLNAENLGRKLSCELFKQFPAVVRG